MRRYFLSSIVILAFLVGIAIGRVGTRSSQLHTLEIVDQDGSVRAEIATGDDGSAFLRFYDESGGVIWEAPPTVKMLPLDH